MSQTSSQKCCQLHGWLESLIHIDGDFVVIIHSDTDCSNIINKIDFAHGKLYDKFFCTNLTDEDIINGKTTEKLDKCINAIVKEIKPKNILILGSCISSIIADNVEEVIDKHKKNNVNIYYQKTSGLIFENPLNVINDVGNWLYSITNNTKSNKLSNLKASKKIKKIDNSINIFGLDNKKTDILKKELDQLAGIKVNSIINSTSDLNEWSKLKKGVLNILFDEDIYPDLVNKFSSQNDIKSVQSSYPVGFRTTLKFYKDVCDALNINFDEKIYNLKPIIDSCILQEKRYLKLTKNKKLFYNISSSLTLNVDDYIKQGLYYIDFLRELKFDITVFVQGNPEIHNQKRVKEILKNKKIFEKIKMFGHCGDAHEILLKNPNSIIVGSDMLSDQISCSSSFISYDAFGLGLNNYKNNLKLIGEEWIN